MSLKEVKIQTADLHKGMYIAHLDRPWLETPYKVQGFMIKSEKDIEKLMHHTEYVFIDTERSKDIESHIIKQKEILSEDEKKQLLTNVKPKRYDEITNFDEEIESVQEKHTVLSNTAEKIMEDIANNKKLNLLNLTKAINPMVESVIRNSGAFSWLARMKSKDNYTYIHSVNTAVLAVAFGRNLGLPKKDLQSLGMGGLLFDIGKMKLPRKLINNPSRYNPVEFKLIKKTC